MLKHNILLAFRHFNRYRTYFTLNVLGFVLGLGIAMTLFWIVRFEKSFDKFHANEPRIFQIMSFRPGDYDTQVPSGIITALNSDFPEVDSAITVHKVIPQVLVVDGQKHQMDQSYFVHPGLFDLLDVQWIQGSPESSFTQPDQVVIDQRTAQRLFGDDDPLGRVVEFGSSANPFSAAVSGVIATAPPNTSFPFEMIFPMSAHPWSWLDPTNDWGGGDSSHKGLVMLKDPSTAPQVAARLTAIATEHESFSYDRLELVPLSEVHTNAYDDPYNYYTPAWALDWLLYAGVFLLIISCINFVNLSTAHAMTRARNTSIRKVLGSSRGALISQVLVETGLLVSISIIIAMGVSGLLLQYINQFFPTQIPLMSLSGSAFPLFAVALAIIVTLAAGAYPAWIISRSSSTLTKQKVTPRRSKVSLRQLLIALQFVIAQVMIVAVLVGSRQVSYLNSKDLGFRTEDIVMVNMPDRDAVKRSRLEQQLMSHPAIDQVSYSLMSPSNSGRWSSEFKHPRFPRPLTARVQFIDENYLDFYDLELIAGRKLVLSDTVEDAVLVTRMMVSHMGFTEPDSALGQFIEGWSSRRRIVGVLENYFSENLKSAEIPNVLLIQPNRYMTANISIHPDQKEDALKAIDSYWSALYPDKLFSYEFIEDHLQGYYDSDTKFANFLGLFATISIVIGCLGLYGLVYFVVLRRTKEIGIRKALGAEIAQIIQALSVGFAKPVVISVLLAVPAVWYLMDIYLSNFVYAVQMDIPTYLVAALLTLAGAAIPVLLQSSRAARQNPVEALRDE